jgi:3'-phosphoadenosine 5'-phosphosulfate sulfotransferase (PAPS reductase)/FAD synthetase
MAASNTTILATPERIPWIEWSQNWIFAAQETGNNKWQFTAGPKENITDAEKRRLQFLGFEELPAHFAAPMTWELAAKLKDSPFTKEIEVEAIPEELPPAKLDMDKYTNSEYELPGDPKKDVYIVATSGGADSTALCVLLKTKFPDVDFKFCFTDTGAENREIYEHLDHLERYIGEPIERIQSERGNFFDMLDAKGHFLPSGQARWCTRDLKILPYQKWLHQFEENKKHPDQQIYSFVGIRADEPSRNGFNSANTNIHTEMPFRNLGMDRDRVFALLQDSLGVPAFYKYRTRSGCKLCPFMRKTEFLGLYRWDQKSFEHGIQYEVLSEEDQKRFEAEAEPVWKSIGWGANWTTLPFPGSISLQDAPPENIDPKLSHLIHVPEDVPMKKIWFGAEFMVDEGMTMFDPTSEGIYWQEPVTFSSTRSGLSRQLNQHAAHRLNTCQASGESLSDMRNNLKLVEYCVEVPEHLVSLEKPGGGSFTWNSQFALKQLKNVYSHVLRTLHVESLNAQLREYQGATEADGWAYEHKEALERALLNLLLKEDATIGRVVEMREFEPKCFKQDKVEVAESDTGELFDSQEYSDEWQAPAYAPGM